LQKTHLLSVEEGAITKFGSISFVTVERFPNFFAAETKYLHAHQSRFLKDPGIAALDKQKTSHDAISIKFKVSKNAEALFCQASPAQRTIDGQKGRVSGRHKKSKR
jgi:hypothetical protein